MAIPSCRFFFDTSVYIAALLSPSGAAGELVRLAEARVIRMVVCEEVIRESDKVLAVKFPELIQESRRLWKHLCPEMAPEPATSQIEPFLKKLALADARILCAAHLAKPSIFVTWNTRDFLSHGVTSLVDFPILVPGDGLKFFRQWLEAFLD